MTCEGLFLFFFLNKGTILQSILKTTPRYSTIENKSRINGIELIVTFGFNCYICIPARCSKDNKKQSRMFHLRFLLCWAGLWQQFRQIMLGLLCFMFSYTSICFRCCTDCKEQLICPSSRVGGEDACTRTNAALAAYANTCCHISFQSFTLCCGDLLLLQKLLQYVNHNNN